ncbi:uncharacterized protein LOC123539613 [Mercenaria mercenaria]|uniref:uncharacterized protein LOC123539613 n=1 Tax=Mercenaria mercenaria TaxID=6596 RepID=UPI00234F46E1|nr:uncharacterized protein LOC123539613 [Mercenaria mercenaria]
MVILLIIFIIVQCATCSLHGADISPNRFSLRKLLQENVGGFANITNATTPASTPVQRHSLAILQVVGDEGLVKDKVSTNENIRLRVKALTKPDYQAPFVKKCWYNQYESEPSDDIEPSKTDVFLKNGCAGGEVDLIKSELVPFEENGVLEVHTNFFKLTPLYDDQFTFLDIRCEVALCHLHTDCYVTCSQRQSKWRMDKEARNVELSTVIEVEKKKSTRKPPAIEEKKDLRDFLISGGRHPPPPRPVPITEAPFLKKYQHYFTVSTLGVCALLLLCVIGIGFMFISYKNNKECDKMEQFSGYLPGYFDKMTGLQTIIGTSQNGEDGRVNEPSPPPEYKSSSAWPGADFNLRSPYRDSGVLTPSEAAVLEARRLLRNNPSPPRMQKHVQRRLALEGGHRGLYGCENEAGRAHRNQPSAWNEAPERFREPADIPTSPVGGEWYPAPSARIRSPQSEPLLQKSPLRGAGKTSSLINMALKEYFDKYGM